MTNRINLSEWRECADANDEWCIKVYSNDARAVLDAVEAARGAAKYARPVDLQAAVFQGGFPDLTDTLARFDFGNAP